MAGLEAVVRFAYATAARRSLNTIGPAMSTSAHMAGALGKVVWIILPQVPDWRWQIGRSDTLWYPRARLFCQPSAGDWLGAVAEVAAALAART